MWMDQQKGDLKLERNLEIIGANVLGKQKLKEVKRQAGGYTAT